MPLLGPIDAERVLDLAREPIEIALHVSLKGPCLTLDFTADGEMFDIFQGPERVWTGRDIDEAVAKYNALAGFTKPADDFADLF